MTRRLPPSVLALTPGSCTPVEVAVLVRRVAQAVQGGLQGLMVREPLLDDGTFLRLAEELRVVLADGWFCVHDRAHLVPRLGADALHVGSRSLPPAAARQVVGPKVAIGLSHHANDGDQDLQHADYRTYGPVHATPSKEGLVAPVGVEGLRVACAVQPIPTWALGGLNPEHVPDVRSAGARGVAVLRGILGSPDPAAATRAYRNAMDPSA